MYEKFGKSFRDIINLKQDFFNKNQPLLTRALQHADFYTSQPLRLHCKICDALLPREPTFVKHRVPYVVCGKCTHLNGMHEDTDEFCRRIYTDAGGGEYAQAYQSKDRDAYSARTSAIYIPKADFLFDVLRRLGEDPTELTYSDMGAGAGYFVSALKNLGVRDVNGYEVGEAQVRLGRWINPDLPLHQIALQDTIRIVRETESEVVTFIGVFEHLQNPREVLRAIKGNRSIRYFYFCVPMFGPCIYNEMSFPNVMPRQLAIGHTHLFTRDSIKHFEDEFLFQSVGAWWFGTDMMDYYRSVLVTLAASKELLGAVSGWETSFSGLVDDLQLAIDRRRESGQVHMVMRSC